MKGYSLYQQLSHKLINMYVYSKLSATSSSPYTAVINQVSILEVEV